MISGIEFCVHERWLRKFFFRDNSFFWHKFSFKALERKEED